MNRGDHENTSRVWHAGNELSNHTMVTRASRTPAGVRRVSPAPESRHVFRQFSERRCWIILSITSAHAVPIHAMGH
jgi:hypothetical protein